MKTLIDFLKAHLLIYYKSTTITTQMKIDQEHTLLPNGEVQIGDLIIGRGGFALIEAAKKRRAFMAKIRLAEMMDEAMKKEGLNQVELAKFLGVTKQAVNKMLNGSTNFTVETLIRLEEVLYADFISSALYKDEAMQREYGVHYENDAITKLKRIVVGQSIGKYFNVQDSELLDIIKPYSQAGENSYAMAA